MPPYKQFQGFNFGLLADQGGVFMKASANMTQKPGVRRVSISAACLAFFLLISEPAYASSNLELSVSIPSVQSNLEVATPEIADTDFDPTPSL